MYGDLHVSRVGLAPIDVAAGRAAMIEMSVRAVKRAGEDRLVAVLERGSGEGEGAGQRSGRLLITVSRPEAHVLYHELRAERTLPGQTFELMAQIVSQLNGKLTAVELVADEAGKPSARLRLERTDGRSTVPTRAGQALTLAVHLKVPLLVAEALLTGEKAQAGAKASGQSAPTEDTPVSEADVAPEATTPIPVPEAFLRAFDE
jgi:bifunctional DNase/RNase